MKILSYFANIQQGKGSRDKIIILLYITLHLISHIFSKLLQSLSLMYTIRNSDGIYRCNGGEFYMMSDQFEKPLRKYFKNFKRGVFVDVGAYIGKYSVMIANQIKNNGQVVSIEPVPKNFKRLGENVALNKCNNVKLVNMACGDERDVETIYFPSDDLAVASLVNVSEKYDKILCDTLDSILLKLNIDRVDLVKIDVENAEARVLKGMKGTLLRSNASIIYEARHAPNAILSSKILSKYGYKTKQIDSRHWIAQKKKY